MLPSLELTRLHDQGLYRKLSSLSGIDFASNDFLGLSRSAKVRQALVEFLEEGGPLGSTGSRLVSGETELLREAEDFLAAAFHAPSALFFGAGYLANLGATGAIGGPDTVFFSDELNHASLIDGMKLTKSKVEIYRHNDMDHLEKLLRSSSAKRKVVATESIFSMDGDAADLTALKALVDRHEAYLLLDEAHATGVAGASGLGCAEGLGFDYERSILIHTCGKALGGYGAFVTTAKSLRELLVNKARSFIYSTAPTPLQAIQTKAAVSQVLAEPGLRSQLKKNIGILQGHLSDIGLKMPASHIAPLLVPGNKLALQAVNLLAAKGLATKAIRYPTVPEGKERIRITVKSFHSEAELALLAQSLKEALP